MYAETQKMEREKLAALESQSSTVQVSLGRIDGVKGEMLMFSNHNVGGQDGQNQSTKKGSQTKRKTGDQTE